MKVKRAEEGFAISSKKPLAKTLRNRDLLYGSFVKVRARLL